MRSLRRVRALTLAAAVVALTTGAQKKSPPRSGIPKLRPGQVWISSVPVGLEVYLGEKQAGEPAGRTPILIPNARDLSHVTIGVQKKEFGGELPDQHDLVDYTAYRTHSLVHVEGTVKTDRSRGLTYRVDVAKKPTVIALFQPRSMSLSDWGRRYPSAANFRFREDLARRDLAAQGVPPEYVTLGVRLLRKGGKIALPGSKGWIIAEVTPSGGVSISNPPT